MMYVAKQRRSARDTFWTPSHAPANVEPKYREESTCTSLTRLTA